MNSNIRLRTIVTPAMFGFVIGSSASEKTNEACAKRSSGARAMSRQLKKKTAARISVVLLYHQKQHVSMAADSIAKLIPSAAKGRIPSRRKRKKNQTSVPVAKSAVKYSMASHDTPKR